MIDEQPVNKRKKNNRQQTINQQTNHQIGRIIFYLWLFLLKQEREGGRETEQLKKRCTMYRANRRHWTLYLPIARNLSRWTLKIITPANIDWNCYGNWHELSKKEVHRNDDYYSRKKSEWTNERMGWVGTCRIPRISICKMLHFLRETTDGMKFIRDFKISNSICQVSIWSKNSGKKSLRIFSSFEWCTIFSFGESRTNQTVKQNR